ncbi:gagpol and env protein precursor, partial [Aphelenchoides avenae]
MEQKFTVGHNPRENGCTERMNGTLKNLLMKMSDGVSELDQRLPYALFFYNTSPHSTTGVSPFFLLHGTDPNFPVCGSPTSIVSPYTVDLDTYKMEIARGMKALYDVTAERIKSQAEAMKRYLDRVNEVGKTKLELFDRVFVFNPNVAVDKDSSKLTPPCEGPFRIVEMSENSATVRYLGPQKLEKRVQKDFLRKIQPEVEDDQFYLFKPDKKRGRPNGPRPEKQGGRAEIGGTLMDFNVGCGCHQLTLSLLPVRQFPAASIWTAENPFELARGGAVAESIKLDALNKDNYYLGASNAVVEDRLAEPTEDQLVQVMLRLVELCGAVRSAFPAHAALKCGNTVIKSKAALKVRVAERVRAILYGNMVLRTDETIVIGGTNAKRFAKQLGLESTPAGTLDELRSFLIGSRFSSSVKRVFIWPEIVPDGFKQVIMSNFIEHLREAVETAAVWTHVVFVVLPMVYASGRRALFDSFMEAFTINSLKLGNVRTFSLGANQLFATDTAMTDAGK